MNTSFKQVKGGITTPAGFKACGIHAGFRKNPNRADFALIVPDEPAVATGVFTQNKFCAAPVQYCKEIFGNSEDRTTELRAIAINSGNANAATGKQGYKNVIKASEIVANELKCSPEDVAISSTGIIGVQLSIEPYENSIREAVSSLSNEGGEMAAKAIMTTDLKSKECCVQINGSAFGYSHDFYVGGMVKGSGMIQPNMATMIAVITTDLPIKRSEMYKMFKHAVDRSFNCVTVDSDTSTNDSAYFLTSGHYAHTDKEIEEKSEIFKVAKEALNFVCIDLAKQIAMDGEGATKVVEVTVEGAKTDEQAQMAARSVANSPLVKTAIAGRDPNWGRIAAALGKSGAQFSQDEVDIDLVGVNVFKQGEAVNFDEEKARSGFENRQIDIYANLHAGEGKARIWTCDLTHDYISINADYSS